MKRILITMTLLLGAALAFGQDITGDWQGTLSAGGMEVRLVLHITKAADGSMHGTLDSIDQNAKGIPISSISLKDSKLSLAFTTPSANYDGTVAKDGKTISGSWTQGTSVPLDFKRMLTPIKTEHKPAKPSDIDGAWLGTADFGAAKLRVVFHIVNTEDGLVATLDSPDQGAKGLPTTSCMRDGAKLRIEAKGIGVVFEGTIAADLASIDGTLTQMGEPYPLLLKRVKAEASVLTSPPGNETPIRVASA